jgi:hypothetical protein
MEHAEQRQIQAEAQPLGRGEFVVELLEGIAIAAGMCLLWVMEVVRNSYFRLLDRWNLKPRRRNRASAFPPGKPRRRPRAESGV